MEPAVPTPDPKTDPPSSPPPVVSPAQPAPTSAIPACDPLTTSPPPSNGANPPSDPLTVAWPASAQWTVFGLLLFLGCLLVWKVSGFLPKQPRPSELREERSLSYRVDLNRADKSELMSIPGVGEKLADAMLEYRRKQPFNSVNDLLNVGGIQHATLEKLRRWVCVRSLYSEEENEPATADTPLTTTAMEREPRSTPKPETTKKTRTTKSSPPRQPVNVNTASMEELETLPWIGPDKAAEIIRERNKSPFKTVEDLCRVKGIKQATLEKIREFVTVNGSGNGSGKDGAGIAKAQ